MSSQQELPTLISRLRQATERQDWSAMASVNLQISNLLVQSASMGPTDLRLFQSLSTTHEQARHTSELAERTLQDEVQILKSILQAWAVNENR
jgi:hypothetical protein